MTKLITTYYKAEIFHASETYVNNDLDEGCDPDTYMESGLIETYQSHNIEDLGKKIGRAYGKIEHVEKGQFETAYNGIERDGTHVLNLITIFVSKVSEHEITIKEAAQLL